MTEFNLENSINTDGETTLRSSTDYALAQANKELDKIKGR